MKNIYSFMESQNLVRILDENNCPVARMRLFSAGIQTNNRLLTYEPVTGDKGCLACGNCVDTCPVVHEKKRFVFTQNQRTSMALESIVGMECRRCYACVHHCPQVNKATKEFVLGFRRGEKFTHAYTATLMLLLTITGIFIYHYKAMIPGWQQFGFRWIHLLAGVLLLGAPVWYFFLDRPHLKRALKNVFCFGPEDLVWLKRFGSYLKLPGRHALPSWHEFNTYHKIWYVYLTIVIPVMGLSGIINILGAEAAGPLLAAVSLWIHTIAAVITDLMVLMHIYFKILRVVFRNVSDMGRAFQADGHLHYPFRYDPKSGYKEGA